MPNPSAVAYRHLLIAIHDVTPAHADRVEQALALLDEFGVESCALLVVPRWHGSHDLRDHTDFTAMIRGRQHAGAEVFLHGLRHDEVGTRRTLAQHIRTFGRTDREAEFLNLPERQAEVRIAEGLEVLEACGLKPQGFVPPAWFHGDELAGVLRRCGFPVSEDAWSVIRVEDGRRIRAPAVQWSTRKRHRAWAGVAIAAARRPLEQGRALLRLAIHPPDVDVQPVADSLRRTLDYLLARRTVITYRAVVEAA